MFAASYTVTLLVTTLCNNSAADPFKFWDNLNKIEKKPVSLIIDGNFSKGNIQQTPGRPNYKDYTGLIDFYLGLPPPPDKVTITKSTVTTTTIPPAPPPIVTPPTVTTTPPPPPNYQPLLNFLRGAPGGSVLTLAHLQHIQPYLMALAGNPRNTQLQYAALQASRSILVPLGVWNQASLNYLRRNSSYAIRLVQQLYYQLTQVGQTITTPGSVIQPPAPPPIVINQTVYNVTTEPVDVLGTVQKLEEYLRTRDWLRAAEEAPRLSYGLVQHLAFSRPRLVIYGSRKKNYDVGLITERRVDGWREVHAVNRNGYLVSDFGSPTNRWYQGDDDITLNYMPIDVSDNRVLTLDVIGSDRYFFMKKACGGDTRYIDRVSRYPVSTMQLAIQSDHLSARFTAGRSSTLDSVGVGGSAEWGNEYIGGRLGAAACLEPRSYSVYAEAEMYLRTPKLSGVFTDEKSVRTWASLSTCLGGIISRHKLFTLQGDIKIVPEMHFQLATAYTLSSITWGTTLSLVPHGRIHLDNPAQSMDLRPVRVHVEGEYKIRLSKLLEHDSDELLINIGAIAEASRLNQKARFSAGLQYSDSIFSAISEIDQYKDSSFMDAYLGAGVGYKFLNAEALKSLKNDDFRISANLSLPL